MAGPTIWTFFYGSYMNLNVLKEVELVPDAWEPARLPGFDITIAPRANLVRSDRGTVYGIIATATHAELDRLYQHSQDVLGERYLPEAVLVESRDGRWRPALCFLCHDMQPRPAEAEYVGRILEPARACGFPKWYLDRIAGFVP